MWGILSGSPHRDMEEYIRVLMACCTLTSMAQPACTDQKNLCYTLGRKHPEIDFIQMDTKRMSIDRFRNTAAQIAIENNIDYIFFIDDDMLMPANTFTLLYEAQYDIIAAFNYIRGYPFKIMSFKYDLTCSTRRLINVHEKDLVDSVGDVLPVDAIGTAVCLIKTSVFKGVPPPYFLTGAHGTEDIYMCLKCKSYNPEIRIGMHTGVITGHLLEPEVINQYTRASLMQYYESFMTPEDIRKVREEDPYLAQVPKSPRINGYRKELTYEEIMAVEMGGIKNVSGSS